MKKNPKPNQHTILILEDEPWFCRVVADCLRLVGHQVVCAEDAQTALDLLDARPDINLIFLDLMLPEYNGLAFIYETMSHLDWQDKRFVMMSSLASHDVIEDEAMWEHLNVSGYLYKPAFEPKSILKLAAQALS